MVCSPRALLLCTAQLVTVLALASCTESSSVAYEVPAPPSEAPLAAEVNPFIGEAHLDDQPLAVPVLSHDAITGGGTLRLLMTATPN